MLGHRVYLCPALEGTKEPIFEEIVAHSTFQRKIFNGKDSVSMRIRTGLEFVLSLRRKLLCKPSAGSRTGSFPV